MDDTTTAPARIWAWCFNSPEHGGWEKWGGFARTDPRRALDDTERLTGAEYIRADLCRAPVAQDAEPVADQIKALIIAAKAAGLTDRVEGLRDAIDVIQRHPAHQASDEGATLRDHLTRAKSAADDALAKAKADQADEGTRLQLKMAANTLGLLLEGM